MTEHNTVSLFCQRHSRLHSPARIKMLKIKHVCVCRWLLLCSAAQTIPSHTEHWHAASLTSTQMGQTGKNRTLPVALCVMQRCVIRVQLSSALRETQHFILWKTVMIIHCIMLYSVNVMFAEVWSTSWLVRVKYFCPFVELQVILSWTE